MTMELCDIFDASEDSLQEAMTALLAQSVSAEQQQMLRGIEQEMAERTHFTHMNKALSSLFSELEVEHDDVLAPPGTDARCSIATEVDGQVCGGSSSSPHQDVDDGVHTSRGQAPSPEQSDMQDTATTLPVRECTPESPDRPPIAGEAVLVDVATAARLAFHAERRKTGHARKALRCSSTISVEQVDSSPPPVGKKPPVPSFRQPPATVPYQQRQQQQSGGTTSSVLPANEATFAQAGQEISCPESATISDNIHRCCAKTHSSESQPKHGIIKHDSRPKLTKFYEVECTSENPSCASERDGAAVPVECSGISAAGAQPALSSRHALATDTDNRSGEDGDIYTPYPFTASPETQPHQEPVQSVINPQCGGDIDSTPHSMAPTWHLPVATISTGIDQGSEVEHANSQSCQIPLARSRDEHAGEVAQAATCTLAHADFPLQQMTLQHSAFDQVLQSAKLAPSASDVQDSSLQPATESPLVLEDSYTGSDASEDSEVNTDFSNREKGGPDHNTYVALAKTDETKMALPSWSAFQAVEALIIDGAGHSTGVSSWNTVPCASSFHLSGANSAPSQQQPCAESDKLPLRPRSASSSSSSSSRGSKQSQCANMSHEADSQRKEIRHQSSEHVYKRGFLKRLGRRSSSPTLRRATHRKGSCEKSSEVEQQEPATGPVQPGSIGISARRSVDSAGELDTTGQEREGGSTGLTTYKAGRLAQDLPLSLDAVLGRSERESTTSTSSMQAANSSQELQPQHPAHPPAPKRSVNSAGEPTLSSSQGSITQLAPAANSHLSSQEQVRAQSTSGLLGSPAIRPVDDLSRGNIPRLSRLYPNLFPSFVAILALYWKPPGNALRPPDDHEKVMRSEESVMMLNDCLDTALGRCDVWCDKNGEHFEAFPEWADTTKGPAFSPDRNCNTPNTQAFSQKRVSDHTHAKSFPGNTPVSSPLSGGQTAASSGSGGTGWHYRGQARARDPFNTVAVPGWVPQLSNGVAKQRFFKIIAGEHPEVEELVGGVLRDMGWLEDSDQPTSISDACNSGCNLWDLCWTWTVRARVPESKLFAWQRINHFQEGRNLTRKDLLTYHLQRHATMFRNSRHAEAFQCLPTTFNLPKEFEAFEKAFMQSATKPAAASKPGAPCRARPEQKAGLNVWIMKPSSSSRGRGIHLLDDISAAVCSQPSVVQRYVTDPYLYQGYKFDLRLYVVVTSFNPLEAFIFKEGFGRFALELYTNDAKQRGDSFVHLTNSSIQVENIASCQDLPSFLAACEEHKAGASKMSLPRLWPLLEAEGLNTTQVWEDICSVTLAALYSAQDAIPSQAAAFELYGVDVMLDRAGKVWLLEVNASPSLGTATPLDKEVKWELIRDVVNLVDPVPVDRVALKHVLSRRQQQRIGPARRSRRQGGGLLSGTKAEEREVLNTDLHSILKGRHPRVVGVMPEKMGKFERIAPCPLLQQFDRMKRGN